MKIAQGQWFKGRGWTPAAPALEGVRAQLVLLFGAPGAIQDAQPIRELRALHPEALLFGCSTAGEIMGAQVSDESLVVTAIHFERTRLKGAHVRLEEAGTSFDAGRRLAEALQEKDLVHVLALSDGLKVNGSELVRGLRSHLPAAVAATGGLSGDGDRFRQTFVLHGEQPSDGVVAAVGFYGDRLQIGYGSLGGWDPFGPERIITRSKGNVLYQLDGQSALGLYKLYLGDHARELPASGLLFPLNLRQPESTSPVVRTILAVDEKEGSVTFAGDVPEGSYARFMKANFDRLIDGATEAARRCQSLRNSSPELAVLISCVGRKLVLKQRIEEEVEGVRDVLGANTVFTGFYSYGEICPFTPSAKCELHNQTMTITTLSER